ncbi:hypothetical protein [Leisingera sp. ANG-DT]|uniref:hypothetical protein n=1 Tax=Leisingera sp. ANG-DT TaxID=1577897 RepID=UPI001269D603|nr:hypothetical protein [Leisingera sp. ANG-DT]
MRKHFFNAAALVTALCSLATSASAEEILLEGTRPKVTVHSAERLSGEIKRQFAYFRKNADFYGALYVNRAEDVAGEFWDTRNIALAKQSAQKSCRLKSQDQSLCELYATVGPRNPANGTGATLSQSGNRTFKKYQSLQKAGKFGAFATTGYGSPGYSWGYSTEVEARASAIRGCESGLEKIYKNTSAHLVQNVMDKKRDTCRVIHVSKP